MAVKHIRDKTWDKVQEQFIKAIVLTKENIKETDFLNLIIERGIENIEEEDFFRLATKRKK